MRFAMPLRLVGHEPHAIECSSPGGREVEGSAGRATKQSERLGLKRGRPRRQHKSYTRRERCAAEACAHLYGILHEVDHPQFLYCASVASGAASFIASDRSVCRGWLSFRRGIGDQAQIDGTVSRKAPQGRFKCACTASSIRVGRGKSAKPFFDHCHRRPSTDDRCLPPVAVGVKFS